MRFGASTFIWASPFSNKTLDLVNRAKDFGFDIIEICVEDPSTIDTAAIRGRMEKVGIAATVCGAFGPDRDLSSDDESVRENGIAYINRCSQIAEALGANVVVGPMYSAVGRTRMAELAERAAQRALAARSIRRAADDAAKRGVRLALLDEIERENVGLLLDTFHMNIEEKDIPDALRRANGRLFEFHACSSDRGTPGEDHLPWPEIVKALTDIGYADAVVIEAFTPEIKEIARAVSIWRPLARSQDVLARDGLAFLKKAFNA